MTSGIPPPLPPPVIPNNNAPPIIWPRPGVVLANRIWCGFITFLHLAVLIWTLLEINGVVEPPTSLTEELFTPKQGPDREALLAEKRQETRELAPMLITSSAIGLGFYCFACFAPRKKSGWAIGLAAIIGSIFPFCVTWIGIVPLLILWCKPQVKSYFANAP